MTDEKYPDISYECGSGWDDLIDDMLDRAFSVDPDLEILQIKEKFGSLRVYYHTESAYGTPTAMLVGGIVAESERRSETICERCGLPGRLLSRHRWFFTACEKHAGNDEVVLDD